MKGALLLVGYGILIGLYGWWGLLACAAHVAIMVLVLPRRTNRPTGHPSRDAERDSDAGPLA